MKRFFPLLLAVMFAFWPFSSALASEYVLPYPSFMPGHKLHTIRRVLERIQRYWYFGDMAQVKYHLQMADKYLVEAKVLFEYDQLKLAVAALEKSNTHFAYAVLYERDVIRDKKDNGEQKNILVAAGQKHTEILNEFKRILPKEIQWQEENAAPETLSLGLLFVQSSYIRGYASQ